jgi:hypothetical protein
MVPGKDLEHNTRYNSIMSSMRRIRLVLTVAFLVLAAILLFWSLLPAGRQSQALPLTVPQLGQPMPFVSLEARQIHLEWPATLRLGETGLVRLKLDPDNLGSATSGAQPTFQDIYEAYNLVAEARLELQGADVQPPAAISEPLTPGGAVTFFWHVRPQQAGSYRGTVWLYLRFIPKGSGEELRQAVSAQEVSLRVVTLFGLAAAPAKLLGAAGLGVASLLGWPFFVDMLARRKHLCRH